MDNEAHLGSPTLQVRLRVFKNGRLISKMQGGGGDEGGRSSTLNTFPR